MHRTNYWLMTAAVTRDRPDGIASSETHNGKFPAILLLDPE